MAMYPYFPQSYQPQMYPQQMQAYAQQTQQQAQQQQIQQSGFIPVASEEVARNYPVAPGNSVSFKNENAPYVYVKTMGYSPLDMPKFERFRLVKEDNAPERPSEPQQGTQASDMVNLSAYTPKSEFEALKGQFDGIKNEIDYLKKRIANINTQASSEVAKNE